MPGTALYKGALNNLLLYRRLPWHVFFWIGYILFRFWLYYITVKYYDTVYLEFMLLSELMFIVITYFTLWLYRRFFETRNYVVYFFTGISSWMLYLYARIAFQFYYLNKELQGNSFADVFLGNITFVVVCLLFITACKYFKDGYIAQHFEAERKEQQLVAEINNLKSQIAPHFLFNTLNNLYGLAVEKSDKLPDLMLRLSDLLRHSLYEAQKTTVAVNEEINVLKSYIKLESLRLENDLELEFENLVPTGTVLQIAPLILIVFIENAFKHAKFVQPGPVKIYINTTLENNRLTLLVKNNYDKERNNAASGIGLANVKRRLDILYPNKKHLLETTQDEIFYTTRLQMQLEKT